MPWLKLSWGMEASKALESPGEPTKRRERKSQAIIAARLGVRRETVNRWVSLFSEPDGRWDEERRRRQSERTKERHRCKGHEVSEQDFAGIPLGPEHQYLLNKDALPGCALRYSLHMDEALKPGIAKRMCPDCTSAGVKKCPHWVCKDAEQMAAAFGEANFDPTAIGVNGDKAIPLYIFDPKHPDANPCLCALGQHELGFQEICPHCGPCEACKGTGKGAEGKCDPCGGSGSKGYVIGRRYTADGKWEEAFLGASPRIFLVFLLMKGLRDKGCIQVKQSLLAEDMGVDPNSFYAWRRKCEWLGYLRVVPGEIFRGCTSCTSRYSGEQCPCGGSGPIEDVKPDKIMWLPDLILDPEIAAREWELLCQRAKAVQDANAARQASDIVRRGLKAWTGQQHSVTAFWNEMRRQLRTAGLDSSVVDILFPRYRE